MKSLASLDLAPLASSAKSFANATTWLAPYFPCQADRAGFGSEGDSLLEDVGTGETATNPRSEYTVWIKTSEYRAVLFARDCQGRGHGLFIHGVLS